MKLIILFGPPAVGKMAVGMELERLTGLRLFHNHMTIELVLPFFDFGSPPFNRLVREFRNRIFREVAVSDLPGMVFTYVWALDEPGDKAFVDSVCEIFADQGAEVHFVELYAPLEERLCRNGTELRLAEKPSKRDVQASEERLKRNHERYRLSTDGDFFYPERHLRIDTTDLSAEEAARRIAGELGLVESGSGSGRPVSAGDDTPVDP